MLVVVLSLNYLKHTFPALLGGGKAPAPEADPPRAWQSSLEDTSEHVERIAEALRLQVQSLQARNEIARREAEAIERVERLLVELLAAQRAAGRATSSPRRSPAA